VRITHRDLDLQLRRTFRIATGALDISPDVLVTLEHEGLVGRGEAHGVPYAGEDREGIRRALDSLGGEFDGDPAAINETLDALPPILRDSHAARAAIDMALHDLAGQMAGQPLWKMFGLDPTATPITSYTIGLDTLENMQAHIREAERYPLLKIKLGTDHDREILDGVRAVTDKPLRADANTAWTPDEAIAKLRAFESYGIEFIEQPIPPGDIDGLRRIRDAVDIPIFADESSVRADDVAALAGAVDGINIKLMKCGGLAEARRMIAIARDVGLQVMLGCFIESSVSITAAAHLSPLADHADLDGFVLIADDPFEGVTLDADARLLLPDRPGLGVVPRRRMDEWRDG